MVAQTSKYVQTTEPVWHGQTDRLDLIKGLNFYNNQMSFADSKQYAIEFFKNRGDVETAESLSLVDESLIKNRGFALRMITRGMKDDMIDIKSIEQHIYTAIEISNQVANATKLAESKKEKVKPAKPLYINAALSIYDTLVDSVIVNKSSVSPSTIAGSKKDLDELKLYVEHSLDELKNFMEYYSPDTIKPLKDFYQSVLKHVINISAAVEKTKTRVSTPKKVNPVKMSAGVKFMKDDPTLKLKSIPISMVVGARKLYVYDTDRRKLFMFVTNSSKGFMFTGTTLKNFDIEKSVSKTIRKPEEFWKDHKVTMAELNKSFGSINGKDNPINSGRLNDRMIILKAAE